MPYCNVLVQYVFQVFSDLLKADLQKIGRRNLITYLIKSRLHQEQRLSAFRRGLHDLGTDQSPPLGLKGLALKPEQGFYRPAH